ncbi:hypothetical protein [Streptomyces cinnamoneus]|uniref:Uncharacterized protein n=1 Tax=Streptomyces cinnamoneus TaxID=53446 RepID=A0A918TNS4_STRCJ|nr:hypothetical protein [Streptomyces cinnamoneus]GHC56565.1 hypothetical protein GCM10010507_36500 [Streptomyces cinnamoneus]
MTKVAAATVLVEMALAYASLWVWGMAHPEALPEGDAGPESPVFAVFALPVVLPFATAAALVFVCAFVLPASVLARRAETRWGGSGAWCWVPAAATVVVAAVIAVVGTAIGPAHRAATAPVYLWWWVALTVATVPAALLARLSSLRTDEGRPLQGREVLGMGCAGVCALSMGALSAVALLSALFG